MKIIAISFLMILLVCTDKHFEVISAHYENWTAGIASGGTGTDYYFKTIIKTDKTLKFDSLWVNGKALKLIAVKGKLYNPNSIITKNDTIMVRATLTSKNTSASSKPPVKFKGIALISYYVNEQRIFYTLKKMEQKERLPHP